MKLVKQTNGTINMLKRLGLGLGALVISGITAHAQTAGAVETAATTMITDAKTAASNVLVAAIAILAAFIVFKLIKRAVNKA